MKKIPFGRWSVEVYDTLFSCMNEESTEEILTISKSIYTLYSTPSRKYHCAYHPVFMLEYAKKNNIELNNAQKLAIVFHDAVYVPGNKDNEELSADYMMCMMSPYVSNRRTLNKAYKIILDTKQHFQLKPRLKTKQSALVLDLDIINMSLDESSFRRWNKAVEEEFAHISTPEERNEFLEFFLSKENILLSDELKHKEDKIRENISALLEESLSHQNV